MRSRNCVVEWLSCDELTCVRALAQTDCNPQPPPICVVFPPCICSVGQTMALSHLQAAPTDVLKRLGRRRYRAKDTTPHSQCSIPYAVHSATTSSWHWDVLHVQTTDLGNSPHCSLQRETAWVSMATVLTTRKTVLQGSAVLGCPHQANIRGPLPSERGFFGSQIRI